jgi:hydrogenase-4 membrane subunit HyfE
MADNDTTGYLQKNLIYALVFNPFLSFGAAQVVKSQIPGNFGGDHGALFLSLSGAMWALFLTICSTTVLLNVYPFIRENKVYSFFCYYLLPATAAIIAGIYVGPPETLPAFLTVTIPFFITQTFFYLKFLKAPDKQ